MTENVNPNRARDHLANERTFLAWVRTGAAIVVFGFIPALSKFRLSQRVDNRFKTVILWGGLRGAVTLALALAVTENPAIWCSSPGFNSTNSIVACTVLFGEKMPEQRSSRWSGTLTMPR